MQSDQGDKTYAIPNRYIPFNHLEITINAH